MLDIFETNDVKKFFPLPEFRDGQETAIKFATNAFNAGKKIVVLEVPTGGGKSAIGMTIANMVEKSYYLTVTKILQDQLMNDFGDFLIDLKGRSAYECDIYERQGEHMLKAGVLTKSELEEKRSYYVDCNSGYCRTNKGREDGHKSKRCFLESPAPNVPKGMLNILPEGRRFSACSYYDQVFRAIEHEKVCMNFHSFIYQTIMSHRFTSRDLMIIDEAHSIESVLMDVISFSLSSAIFNKHNIDLPVFNSIDDYLNWFKEEEILKKIALMHEKAKQEEDADAAEDLARLCKRVMKFEETVQDTEWVVQIDEDKRTEQEIIVTFKPVQVKHYSNDMLFKYGEKVLLMSATILDPDVFCRSLGIHKDDVAFYKMRNRFPVENRKIFINNCGSLTGGKAKMDQWMPNVIDTVENILAKHQGCRGIIHTHNFAIMEGLLDGCAPKHRERFITQKDYPDKKILLEQHAKRQDSVIVAPAMHEGIDLKDELSRFQVIAKVPYPNFFDDLQLNRRNQIDPNYISWLVALKLVQSYGRSIRGPQDYADTYIIDGSIYGFVKRNRRMLPAWFLEAFQEVI